jgi:hypothetical protein
MRYLDRGLTRIRGGESMHEPRDTWWTIA